jgi:hypothetical protein
MSQMTPQVARLLEQALALSVEEQEALADSLISNLGGRLMQASRGLGRRDWQAHRRARLRQSQDGSVGRSARPQLSQVATCALSFGCTRKPAQSPGSYQGAASAAPQHPFKPCHPDRSRIIHAVDDPAKWRDLLWPV